MKNAWKIGCLLLFLLPALTRCKKDDLDIPAQQVSISDFLTRQQLEYTVQDGVYKYTFNPLKEVPGIGNEVISRTEIIQGIGARIAVNPDYFMRDSTARDSLRKLGVAISGQGDFLASTGTVVAGIRETFRVRGDSIVNRAGRLDRLGRFLVDSLSKPVPPLTEDPEMYNERKELLVANGEKIIGLGDLLRGEGTELSNVRFEVVEPGDAVRFRYSGYLFSESGKQGRGALFVTNNPQDTVGLNWNDARFDFNPEEVVLGSGTLISGLERGIPGNSPGDSMLLYLTSDLTYGLKPIGIVEAGKQVVFKIIIEE